MGCSFALFGGLFPRLALLRSGSLRPALVGAAFNTFLLPLLGSSSSRWTLIYVVVYPRSEPHGLRLVLGDPRRHTAHMYWSAGYTHGTRFPGSGQ